MCRCSGRGGRFLRRPPALSADPWWTEHHERRKGTGMAIRCRAARKETFVLASVEPFPSTAEATEGGRLGTLIGPARPDRRSQFAGSGQPLPGCAARKLAVDRRWYVQLPLQRPCQLHNGHARDDGGEGHASREHGARWVPCPECSTMEIKGVPSRCCFGCLGVQRPRVRLGRR